MKTTIFYLFFFIFGAFNCLTQGQFKIRNDEFIQIGYTGYKALTFGQGTGSPNNGAFALEYCSGCTVAGLNFWKPWPTSNAANYLLFIRNNGNIGIGNSGSTTDKLWISGNLRVNSTLYSSDERFKKEMKLLGKDGLNNLLLIKPYQYIFDNSFNDKK
ncbi:MAG TPA: hypothetical protein VKZ44_04890, partial [Taishania sp.]|nr:hypothetical protein [Taishania sp.]